MSVGSPEWYGHCPEVRSVSAALVPVGQTAPMDDDGTVEPVDGAAGRWFDESTFPAPVFIGDTLRFETEVVAARASGSRPDAGIVTFEHRAHNQRDELVCRTRRNALMRRRP